jgi:uncharacterized protein
LGMSYVTGQGVQQDYKEAFKWYRLSAEQGYANAQSDLGLMYYHGLEVSKDYMLAHMWSNLAGSQGYKDGIKIRNAAEKQMTSQQIEKAQEMARNWKSNK